MRQAFVCVAASIALAACGSESRHGESDLSVGAAAGPDLGGLAQSDLGNVHYDLAHVVEHIDLAKTDDGGVGLPCTTACDCQAGLGCESGMCATTTSSPMYCCTSMTCPQHQDCQEPSGNINKCDVNHPDAAFIDPPLDAALHQSTPDAGLKLCGIIDCSSGGVSVCIAQGCSMCVAQGAGMVCAN